jgi:hypothetical protein
MVDFSGMFMHPSCAGKWEVGTGVSILGNGMMNLALLMGSISTP